MALVCPAGSQHSPRSDGPLGLADGEGGRCPGRQLSPSPKSAKITTSPGPYENCCRIFKSKALKKKITSFLSPLLEDSQDDQFRSELAAVFNNAVRLGKMAERDPLPVYI